MKILICHSSLGTGGIESMVVGLANELAKKNDVEICLVFKPKENDICYKKLRGNIKVHTLGKVGRGIDPSIWFKFVAVVKKGNYDAIHLNGFFFYYFIAIVLLHARFKFFYTVHNDAVKENVNWDKHLIPLKKWCFRKRWMHGITISKSSQYSYEKFYNAPNTLIYNGVPRPDEKATDLLEYKKSQNTIIFFNPGRIVKQKNQLMLCRVFKRLIDEGEDVCLLMAGSKDDLMIYAQLKPYLSDRILYLGERKDAVGIMMSAQAMCLSSIYEGMPITLIEALSVGCIPICTPVGGIVDVVKNAQNGFLSKDVSEKEYYNTIKEFLNYSDCNRALIAKNCLATFENFDIKNTANLYESAFKD